MTSKEIWVFLERNKIGIEEVSLEILGKAVELSGEAGYPVVGVMLGMPPSAHVNDAFEHGASRVIVLRHERLEEYSTDLYVKALYDETSREVPEVLLIGATPYGRDLAGRLAARLKTGLTANAVTLRLDKDGTLTSGVPAYGGKIMAEINCQRSRPQMSTVRPGTFKIWFEPGRTGEVREFQPDLTGTENRVKVIERNVSRFSDLTRSSRTVIGGNGTHGDLSLVRELAEHIQADIGVTRPLADRGIAPRDLQVGSSGFSLRSRIAVVLGVSGSEHFTSGIRDCETVISIDVDARSEIFGHSDYCIVGDLFEILPMAIKKLEKAG